MLENRGKYSDLMQTFGLENWRKTGLYWELFPGPSFGKLCAKMASPPRSIRTPNPFQRVQPIPIPPVQPVGLSGKATFFAEICRVKTIMKPYLEALA